MEEAGLLLLTTVIKTNEELITRMENNIQQLKNELQNKLRNPSLGDTDKQLWTMFAHKTLEQLESTLRPESLKGRKERLPPSPQQAPQKTTPTQAGRTKGRAKERTTRNTLEQ